MASKIGPGDRFFVRGHSHAYGSHTYHRFILNSNHLHQEHRCCQPLLTTLLSFCLQLLVHSLLVAFDLVFGAGGLSPILRLVSRRQIIVSYPQKYRLYTLL